MTKFFLALLVCIIFVSCAPKTHRYSGQKEIHQLLGEEFTIQKFSTSSFILYGLLRPAKNNNKTLHVYIEGDGLAWLTRNRQSNNPTPSDSVTRNLVKHDTSNAAVLYLARPCQYQSEEEIKLCNPKFWATHRLAPQVINSLSEAIDQAKKKTGSYDVSLVGFSGGGGAAVLVAAQRDDVRFLGTVAGLLDHKSWTKKQNITPLHGSLNPVDVISKIQTIPQRHLRGTKDPIVIPAAQEQFCKKIRQKNACIEIQNFKHNDKWHNVWNYNMM